MSRERKVARKKPFVRELDLPGEGDRNAMDRNVSAWIKLSLKWAAVAATAAGISVGTQFTDAQKIADLERRLAENERRDETAHSDCACFRRIDLSGFCDPRAVHAIDQQIQRSLKDYESREHSDARWRRLKQLNPSLTILNGD